MGIQSGTEKRAALAYAESQGWAPPGAAGDAMRIADLERQLSDARGEYSPLAGDLEKAEGKIADLEVALATERESHEVTKAALLRARGKGAGQRIAALEASLVRLTGDDVTEADLAAAKALLK